MNFPPNTMAHFAINADDVATARAFYGKVFGWTFAAWGPPGFYQIENAGTLGALQGRRELVKGTRTTGFECTFAVPSIDATTRTLASLVTMFSICASWFGMSSSAYCRSTV